MMSDNSILKRLKILELVHETEKSRSILLEPLDGWDPHYQAGQFITLVFHTPHGEKRRSFSITSLPEEGNTINITVKKIDNGEFSRPLVYNSKTGDILISSGISGVFILPENAGEKQYCFLAAGSGITPCYALIKKLLISTQTNITLFYSNSHPHDALFYDELRELENKYLGRIRIRFLFSNHQDLYYRRLGKWLLEHLLVEYLGANLENTLFYLCGPFEYMQMAEIVLHNKTSRNNIIKENFSSLPRMVNPLPPDTKSHQVVIRINDNIHTLIVQYPDSILKAAKKRNISLPYSCEAGRCAACVANCTKGEIWMAYNEVLTDKEVAKGRILTCQGFPIHGDAELVFDKII